MLYCDSNMKVQYISDIHLEHYDDECQFLNFPVEASILCLCGDIGSPCLPHVQRWIQAMTEKYEHVMWIPGNHEYYERPMDETNLKFDELERCYKNLYILRDHRVDIGSYTFLGSTLWSNLEDDTLAKYVNDYKVIKVDANTPLTPKHTRSFHNTSVKFLDDQIYLAQLQKRNVVVLTHHAPDHRMNGHYMGCGLASAFATNLPHLFRPPVKLWINGHTHVTIRIEVNGIPCIANCIGDTSDRSRGIWNATYELN